MALHSRARRRGALPEDESWHKLPFFAAHHAGKVLIADPAERTVTRLGRRGGDREPIARSSLIALGASELAAQLDWP